jgi:transposase InsO family protein
LRRRVERGQYVALTFGQTLRKAGIAQSMGSKGDCFDNAVCESFHATLEKELLRSRSFKTRQEAKTAIFTWIESWYNPSAATPGSATSHLTSTSASMSVPRRRFRI